MPQVKSFALDGSETAIKFGKSYPHYFVLNMGDSEVYASAKSGITPYADGVYTILPGMEMPISPEHDGTIYLLGSGMVQVRAEEIAVPTSFRKVLKGGVINNSSTFILNLRKPLIGILWEE